MEDKKMKELEQLCRTVANYLKNNWDPHCTVVITDSQIKLVRDEIGIPVRTAREVPEKENLFKNILSNAAKNTELTTISEQLGISIKEAKNLRKGGDASINSDKLIKFISEYIANPRVIIKD